MNFFVQISDFLEMEGPPQPHSVLAERGQLYEWKAQWASHEDWFPYVRPAKYVQLQPATDGNTTFPSQGLQGNDLCIFVYCL